MPDGSPIDQWWKSHRSETVSTNAKTAVHLAIIGQNQRRYCGHRGGEWTTDPPRVTCSACISAARADAETGDLRA